MGHHLSRVTRDIPRLRDFYINVMGFEPLHRPTLDMQGAWIQLGDVQLHIIEKDEKWDAMPEDPHNTNGKPWSEPMALTQGHHVAFRTDHFQEVKQTLDKMGIPYYEEIRPRDFEGAQDQLWFYDPDGNGIEILQPRKRNMPKSKL